MEFDREEAKRTVAKIQTGEKLSEDEVEYLMQIAKKAIKDG